MYWHFLRITADTSVWRNSLIDLVGRLVAKAVPPTPSVKAAERHSAQYTTVVDPAYRSSAEEAQPPLNLAASRIENLSVTHLGKEHLFYKCYRDFFPRRNVNAGSQPLGRKGLLCHSDGLHFYLAHSVVRLRYPPSQVS